jgi:hypothetical protein
MAKTNPMRVWNIINPPRKPRVFPVNDINHARALTNALAESQLLDSKITDNAFGLEVWEDGGWVEWSDDDGYDLRGHFENLDSGKE